MSPRRDGAPLEASGGFMLRRTFGPVLCCALAACVGDIAGAGPPDQGGGSPSPMDPQGGRMSVPPGASAPVDVPGVVVPAGTRLTFSCTHPEKQGIANNGLRRLTRTQLANTLRDLLGADVLADQEIQTSLNRLGADAVTADISQFPA